MSKLNVSSHPLIAHKMTLLRDKSTLPHEFRRLLREITFFLAYDATKEVNTKSHSVTTPMNMEFAGAKLADNIAVIPVCK